jgi:hypothetical protein
MIGYRDMTFCTGDGCAKFGSCYRALTEKVKEDAKKWWGGHGAPITRYSKPRNLDCWTPNSDAKAQEATKANQPAS